MTNFGAIASASIIALGLLGSTAMGLHFSPYETCMRTAKIPQGNYNVFREEMQAVAYCISGQTLR
jgi:hypothetical protein